MAYIDQLLINAKARNYASWDVCIEELCDALIETRDILRDISKALSGGECPIKQLAEQVGIMGQRYAEQVDLCSKMRKQRDDLKLQLDSFATMSRENRELRDSLEENLRKERDNARSKLDALKANQS